MGCGRSTPHYARRALPALPPPSRRPSYPCTIAQVFRCRASPVPKHRTISLQSQNTRIPPNPADCQIEKCCRSCHSIKGRCRGASPHSGLGAIAGCKERLLAVPCHATDLHDISRIFSKTPGCLLLQHGSGSKVSGRALTSESEQSNICQGSAVAVMDGGGGWSVWLHIQTFPQNTAVMLHEQTCQLHAWRCAQLPHQPHHSSSRDWQGDPFT